MPTVAQPLATIQEARRTLERGLAALGLAARELSRLWDQVAALERAEPVGDLEAGQARQAVAAARRAIAAAKQVFDPDGPSEGLGHFAKEVIR